MKYRSLLVSGAAVLALASSGCFLAGPDGPTISFVGDARNVVVGQSLQLEALNTSGEVVNWTVNQGVDPGVGGGSASIDATGKLTALAPGFLSVYATLNVPPNPLTGVRPSDWVFLAAVSASASTQTQRLTGLSLPEPFPPSKSTVITSAAQWQALFPGTAAPSGVDFTTSSILVVSAVRTYNTKSGVESYPPVLCDVVPHGQATVVIPTYPAPAKEPFPGSGQATYPAAFVIPKAWAPTSFLGVGSAFEESNYSGPTPVPLATP